MQANEFAAEALKRLGRPAGLFTAVVVTYALVTTVVFGPRFEPYALLFGAIVLQNVGPRIKDLFERLVPYLLFVVAYDAVRYGRDAFLTEDRVNVCGIRSVEQHLLPLG